MPVNTRHKTVTPWKRFRYRLETAAVNSVGALVRLLPRTAAYNLGRALGTLAYGLGGDARRTALANLDTAFGDTKSAAEKRRIAHAAFQNALGTLVAHLWSPRLNDRNIHQFIEVAAADVARARELLARGKGVIFLTLHYGDWELLGLATGFYGIRLNVIAEQMRNAALDDIFTRLRSRTGHQIIPQRGATTKLLAALDRGEAVALLIDLNARRGSGGIWVDFFGLPVFNNVGVAALALRTGAPILVSVAEPIGHGRVRVRLTGPLAFQPTGDREQDLRRLSQQCLTACEELIRARPEFWLWTYKRWRYRPHADLGCYPAYSRYVSTDR